MNIVNVIGKYRQSGRYWYQRKVSGIKVISVHHSATRNWGSNDQQLQELFNIHKANGWPGTSYHFVITRDGTVYQINNFSDVTWIDSINWDAVGVCLIGYNHAPYNEQPTPAQLQGLRELLDNLSTQHPEFPADQGDVYAHRERYATACNGDLGYPYVWDYRQKLGKVSWGGGVVVNPFKEKCEKLRIAVDRVKNELGSDLAHSSPNFEAVYNSTIEKLKRIITTGTL